jgi:hypothetical protein
MKFVRHLKVSLLVVAALISVASPGSAQSNIEWKFTLPSQTYWGKAVLQPGPYRLSLLHGMSVPVFLVTGEKQRVFVLGTTVDDVPMTEQRNLQLRLAGDKAFVEKLVAGDIGMVVTFHMEEMKPEEMARAEKGEKSIPLYAMGK